MIKKLRIRHVAIFALMFIIAGIAASIPQGMDSATASIADPLSISSDPVDQIHEAALKYGVSEAVITHVATCESQMRNEGIYGDGGLAYGIMQFHYPTFEMFKKSAGLPELEYKSQKDQIELAAWAIKNGLGYHWTCYNPSMEQKPH